MRNKLKTIIGKSAYMYLYVIASIVLSSCVYYKPAYKGQVIDTTTRRPIEGVVVVVIYNRSVLLDKDSEPFDVKEYVTDSDGMFYFPSYVTLLRPITTPKYTEFIIFKPGYSHYSLSGISWKAIFGLDDIEGFFSNDFGKKKDLYLDHHGVFTKDNNAYAKYTAFYGIVEMSKMTTINRNTANSYLPYIRYEGRKKLPKFENALREGGLWLKSVPIVN